jgi:hypothetical protein
MRRANGQRGEMISELPAMKTPTMNHRSFELRGMSCPLSSTMSTRYSGGTEERRIWVAQELTNS